MSDITSILSNSYYDLGGVKYSKSKYVAVDPKRFEGTWSGKYGDGKKFEIQVSQVSGFKAMVKYTSAGTVKYSQVLIKDDAFRIGDTKVAVIGKKAETAAIATAVTDPYTGQSYIKKAVADHK